MRPGGLGQVEGQQHGVVILGYARLRLAREIDEVAHHGEDVGILGELRAQGQCRRVLNRAIALVIGHDAPARHSTVRIDVVDEVVVHLILVFADLIDVRLDAGEVDERHSYLHRPSRDPHTKCRRRRARARRGGRRAALRRAAARGEQEGSRHDDDHPCAGPATHGGHPTTGRQNASRYQRLLNSASTTVASGSGDAGRSRSSDPRMARTGGTACVGRSCVCPSIRRDRRGGTAAVRRCGDGAGPG